MRNANVLTIIPGYDDGDLTQVQIDYVPTTHNQTVEYWNARVGETRSSIMDGLEDPIAIHSVTIAHVAAGARGNGPCSGR